MSWCGGGEIRPTPGVECRSRAMRSSTLWPGSWPPSPGFAPWAILICSWSASTRYCAVTPKRADATCLIAERRRLPSGSGIERAASSPPSPVLERAPRLFIAIASVSCASGEIEPRLIAPVANRLTISLDGSTSSSGTGSASGVSSSRPRSVVRRAFCPSMAAAKASNDAWSSSRTARCRRTIESGFQSWCSPRRRCWYSPPGSSSVTAPPARTGGKPRSCRSETSSAMSGSSRPPTREMVPVK